MQSRSGFTIVELLLVIIVISILAGVSVAAFGGLRAQSLESIVKSDIRTSAWRVQRYSIDTGGWPTAWQQMVGPTWGTASKEHGVTVSNRSHYSELATCFYFNNAAQGGWPGPSNSDGMALVGKIAASGKVIAASTQDQVSRDITAEYATSGGTSICAGFAQAYSAKVGGIWNLHPYVRANNS